MHKHSPVRVFLGDVARDAVASVCGHVGRDSRPILCADSFYCSRDVMDVLHRHNIPYHMSCQANRIPPMIAESLTKRVTSHEMWVWPFNRSTHEEKQRTELKGQTLIKCN